MYVSYQCCGCQGLNYCFWLSLCTFFEHRGLVVTVSASKMQVDCVQFSQGNWLQTIVSNFWFQSSRVGSLGDCFSHFNVESQW